jgi:SPP1 family predicted phage head-tail adaptor
MTAGALDRRIQFERASLTDDGFGSAETWGDYGSPVWASRRDVNDTEKWASGQVSATLMSRFVVRWSSLTAALTAKDRFTCDGRAWEILGLKERGRREWIEITATSAAD